MPSVYNYRHVELDKVGRGKRVIQPPGGQTADIFGGRPEVSYSSASSQAGSDVASSRVHIESDQQSIGGGSSIVDGMMRQQQQVGSQVSPNGSVMSQQHHQQQPLLMAEDFKPVAQVGQQQQQQMHQQSHQMQHQQQQQPMNPQQQQAAAAAANAAAADGNRSPKKTIPVIRRNPITGEIYDNPSDRQQAVIRVRQPPGGRSSGIF